MCGIVAMRAKHGQIPMEALRRGTEALRHRGPDGEFTWTSPSAGVGLGHTRLAIIDPGSVQPIASEDGQRRIIANGEFYGFEAIRRSLEKDGHRFRTRSDSEIALHLYEDMGARCLEHLRGQFAFVIWDEQTGTLFAARDRFGIKPLLYCETGGVLYLASEAKALFAAGIPRGWDPRGLYHALHACPAEEISLFSGIHQVPPGHMLVSTDGRTRLTRYWDVPPPAPPGSAAHDVDLPECTERVRTLVEESVRLRMRADVPVGCLLSGGLDSSSVLGIAATCTESPVSAFTVGFDHQDYDESAGAREMARHAGANHELVEVTSHHLADHFRESVWHAETVQYNSHGTARFLLSRAVHRAGYKTVLAGEGADEVFFGYEFSRAVSTATPALAWTGKLALALRLLRSPKRRYPGLAATSPWLARLASMLDLSPALLMQLTQGLDHLRCLQSPDFLREFEGYDVYQAYYRRCDEQAGISGWEPARRITYLWLHSLFVNYHLAADRLDMAHGVEVRLPFLDHVLFEYAHLLPLSILATPDREKVILREAVQPYISDAVYRRTKKPFWAPPAAAQEANPLRDLVQDTLRGSDMASVPFFDHAAVVRLLDRQPDFDPKARTAVDSLLLVLTSVCMLQERFQL